MCGIVGAFCYSAAHGAIDPARIERARDSMRARGPDAAGLWVSSEGNVVLGHRRLAIIDLDETANQPMQLADRLVQIVFNGEIYNYQELREDLKARGCRFRTNSDTEVILHLYDRFGSDCVDKLQGMFAFALWDGEKRAMLLARDPLGIKPLYFSDDGDTLRFASQVSALSLLHDRLTPDPAGHLGFFINGYVPDPFTPFKEIRALPAGTWSCRTRDKSTTRKYFSVLELVASASGIAAPLQPCDLSAAISDSIKAHMVADVDVGVFLSAGVDSTTIAWLAAKSAPERLKSITLGAELSRDGPHDEIPLARLFAEQNGLDHQVKYLRQDDFSDVLKPVLEAMDQPSIDGVNTYFVSKLAAQAGLKVALSGLGGDELFRGYSSFQSVPRLVGLLWPFARTPRFGRFSRQISAPFLRSLTSPKYASLLEYGGTFTGAYMLRRSMYMPWELRVEDVQADLSAAWEQLQAEEVTDQPLGEISDPGAKVSVLELTRYMRGQLLRDSDWAGMASSLEIRVPFVDRQLLQTLAPLLFVNGGITKPDMARSVSHPMISEIVERSKTGFSLPVRQWLMEEHNIESRGLRGWAGLVYQEWCRINGCEQLIQSDA